MKYLEIDELDVSPLAYTNATTEGATLPELCNATSESYCKVWYRINTLARVGLLKLIRSRRRIFCFMADGGGE
ncbi:MAG: hypothetical protein ACXVIT_10440 [Halobacteriota archaeon]